MKTLPIREFSRSIYKHIKKRDDIVVTIKGKEAFRVLFCRDIDKDVVTIPKKNVVTKIPTSNIDIDGKEHRIIHYGCGCIKEDGRPLCSRHNRA